ncbi:MAG: SagB/ThcOx family dehydrogenase [Bacteroidales bacterium]|jgi:hypothetical protein|nr:SagB/ThcOx family dehydrogenase [Bacteroidales bacterium]
MKKISILAIILVLAASVSCIQNVTQLTEGEVLEQILMKRCSIREFSSEQPSQEVLLELLWAANGVNRENGKRTAPSAINAQDINLYLCLEDGVSFYNPQEKSLVKVSDVDLRPLISPDRNNFMLDVPVVLLISDMTSFARLPLERGILFGAMDAGYVSQNIYLYCAANTLATVACAPRMDDAKIREILSLPETMIPMIYHPVGFPVVE